MQRALLETGVYARGRRAQGTGRCFKGRKRGFKLPAKSHCFFVPKGRAGDGQYRDVISGASSGSRGRKRRGLSLGVVVIIITIYLLRGSQVG